MMLNITWLLPGSCVQFSLEVVTYAIIASTDRYLLIEETWRGVILVTAVVGMVVNHHIYHAEQDGTGVSTCLSTFITFSSVKR